MEKVYLVNIHTGSHDDYHWWVDSIWDNPEKAELRIQEIEKSIDLLKMEYENRFGSSFEDDVNYIHFDNNYNEEKYDEITSRMYSFEAEHKEMEYHTMDVVEHFLNQSPKGGSID